MNAQYTIVLMSKKSVKLPGKPVDPKAWSNTLKTYENIKRWSVEKPMGGKK